LKLGPGDREAIEEIVEAAVKATLLSLNIDTSTPEKVIEFRNTMTDVSEWRRSMRTIKQAGLTAAIGTVATGMLAALWIGFQGLTRRPRRALRLKGDGDALWCASCDGKWACTEDSNEDQDGDPHEKQS